MDSHKEVVIVTGSSGLIGYPAAKRFVAEGYATVGFDREGPPHPPPTSDCVCVDLTSDESVRRGLDGVRARYGERIAAVIHLAAYYDFSGEPSPLYDKLIVRGTARVANSRGCVARNLGFQRAGYPQR